MGDAEAVTARPRVAKTIEFDADQFDELGALQQRTRRPSFSEAVRVAVRHGLQRIGELESEGRLVA